MAGYSVPEVTCWTSGYRSDHRSEVAKRASDCICAERKNAPDFFPRSPWALCNMCNSTTRMQPLTEDAAKPLADMCCLSAWPLLIESDYVGPSVLGGPSGSCRYWIIACP